MSMKWGYCKRSGHLKSKMLYVKSLWKLLRASSFHFCYLIVTFIFAHGVMKFLESMALAGNLFHSFSAYLGGRVERPSQSRESGVFSCIFSLAYSFPQFSVFSFRNFRESDVEPPGFCLFPPGLVFIYSYLFIPTFYFLIVLMEISSLLSSNPSINWR